MKCVLMILDLGVVVAAFMSGLLWWQASRRRLRRVSRTEILDHADYNRMIVALNRAQILNSRAAMMTATAAGLGGLSLLAHLIFETLAWS